MGITQKLVDAQLEFWEWMDSLPIEEYVFRHGIYLEARLEKDDLILAFNKAREASIPE